jgi:bifunctional DNA-binding transcriptional regulator/antitoxin component of YhaV-PrlF toxin-antitoxin module
MQNSGETQSWPAQIDSSGRLLIPAESRHALGWDRGTSVVIESDGDSLRVLTLDQFTKEVQEMFGSSAPGEPLWSDELIAERQQEAVRERVGD